MTINEAAMKLAEHLGDPEVFIISHDGKVITVVVNFVYRYKDVKDLNGMWEGYPVSTGRISCW